MSKLDPDEYSEYINKAVTLMRPYVDGEDMTGITVSGGVTPSIGGMIAMDKDDTTNKWYIDGQDFRDNFAPAGMYEKDGKMKESVLKAIKDKEAEDKLK